MFAPIFAMSKQNSNEVKVTKLVSKWWRPIGPPKPMPFPLHHANIPNAVARAKQDGGSCKLTLKMRGN